MKRHSLFVGGAISGACFVDHGLCLFDGDSKEFGRGFHFLPFQVPAVLEHDFDGVAAPAMNPDLGDFVTEVGFDVAELFGVGHAQRIRNAYRVARIILRIAFFFFSGRVSP